MIYRKSKSIKKLVLVAILAIATILPAFIQTIASPLDADDDTKVLHGKAEIIERHDNAASGLRAAEMYKRGVQCLATKRYGVAADCFKWAGDEYASADGNEKFVAESRYAEAQACRLSGQTQMAKQLYQEAIDLFRQYDPLSPYLKAAQDHLENESASLRGRASKAADARLKAIAVATGIQSVERDVFFKGRATDSVGQLQTQKSGADINEALIKKTVLQAFIKMTCLETAELGSNYYTAADRYMPLKANGRTLAISASSGFLAPVINIRLNGRYYNVGVDLPELSTNRRSIYLVTDGRNVLAIDPATYDVWKLYGNFKKQNAEFEWQKLTHHKNLPRRISPGEANSL